MDPDTRSYEGVQNVGPDLDPYCFDTPLTLFVTVFLKGFFQKR